MARQGSPLPGSVTTLAFALLFAVASAGCGGIREHVAKERYLGQMLYDYVYEYPLADVWPEAMALVGQPPDAGQALPHGREWRGGVSLYGQNSQIPPAPVRVAAEALGERRTRLVFLRDVPDGPEARRLEARDVDARLWDLELKLLRRLEPKDARRLEDGALRAARRARSA